MVDTSRFQQLPELQDKPAPKVGRTTAVEKPVEEEWIDIGVQLPKPTKAVSQWRLLKILKSSPHSQMGLSDFRWLFQLGDSTELIDQGLAQLERAGRVRVLMGSSQRTGMVGKLFRVTPEGMKNVNSPSS